MTRRDPASTETPGVDVVSPLMADRRQDRAIPGRTVGSDVRVAAAGPEKECVATVGCCAVDVRTFSPTPPAHDPR